MTEEETQRLQTVVDKAKTLAFTNQALTPPPRQPEDEGIQIAIIRSLEFSDKKAQDIFFEFTGTVIQKGKVVVVDPEPIMNLLGGKRLLTDLKSISESSFSNLKEDEIGEYMAHFFEEIWPYYVANRIRYGINSMDMGHLKLKLQNFLLSCFSKGKNAKLLNVIGRTYSEDWGNKLLRGEEKNKHRESFIEKMNPFKKL